MLKWIISFLTFSLLLGGKNIGAVPPCHVVTEISVTWTENGTEHHRNYTDQRKMEKVLLYLRSLNPQPSTEIPEILDIPEYQICLHLSDDSQVFYTQYGLSFFSKAESPLLILNPEKAVRFVLILEAVPSDINF